ncbi:alpha/beta fold hydrolase [Planomicrobium okeanokoites]|uniref:Alpha/beta fold hydrolase n=1 Tax=Planomicrobium okeanokoites TaxID=244 RepID=A0ABV7KQ16_PLAOK|nr:alpha/beta hydrolase [Planomicrobium okeanokoites]TAA71092.1 alpha/beta fold hydrolase [Planomicrobium okeanokoites]
MILHTEIQGSGEAIVFLHTGLQTSKTDFIQQQALFSENYQVITPDLRGHGMSASMDISNFFEDSANDLNETFENLGLESVHLAGASLGALVAIYFAKRFPDKVKTLILSGVTKEKPSNWKILHQQDADMQAGLLDNAEAVSYFTELHGAGWKRFIKLGQSEDWYPFNETSDLSAIACPILVIAGESSPHECRSAVEYSSAQENIHISIIPFASHLVHSEQPEAYSEVTGRFLLNI